MGPYALIMRIPQTLLPLVMMTFFSTVHATSAIGTLSTKIKSLHVEAAKEVSIAIYET